MNRFFRPHQILLRGASRRARRVFKPGLPGATVSYAYTPDSLDAGHSVLTASNAILTRALTRDPLRPSLILSVSNRVDAAPGALPPSERGVAQGAGGSTPCDDPIAIPSFAYAYDALGRPVARNADAFGYDALGQVVSARFGEGADPDLYDYDFIGNFTSNCLRNAWAQFEANELNEYVSITNHPNHPTHQNHPNHPNLSYDPDGNLLTNGVWSCAYDSHNRLTTVWSNGVFVLENRYDFASRRILKRTPAATHRYYYDGWNPVCEIVVSGNATNRIDYSWGKDISGTLQDTGGIEGLLAVRTDGNPYYPVYDDNGNIVACLNDVGAVVASYAYDAFGNTLSTSGPLDSAFTHRFSTKPLDSETGLYYYGYRFYAPALGRWMNRDLLGEPLSINLMACCRNRLSFAFDVGGLFDANRNSLAPSLLLSLYSSGLSAQCREIMRFIIEQEKITFDYWDERHCECVFLYNSVYRKFVMERTWTEFWINRNSYDEIVQNGLKDMLFDKLRKVFGIAISIIDFELTVNRFVNYDLIPAPDNRVPIFEKDVRFKTQVVTRWESYPSSFRVPACSEEDCQRISDFSPYHIVKKQRTLYFWDLKDTPKREDEEAAFFKMLDIERDLNLKYKGSY